MGSIFATIAFGMLVNLGIYESVIAEALHTDILFYLSGLLSLPAGLAIITLHNTWRMDWRMIITVLGWLNDDRRLIRIAVPQVAIAIGLNRCEVPSEHRWLREIDSRRRDCNAAY
jgi:hypothetical protein